LIIKKRFSITLASGSWDKTIKIWDTVKGIELKTLKGHESYVNSLAVIPDNTLASGSYKEIKIWDTVKGIELKTLKGHNSSITALAVLPDKTLASGSIDKTIIIWE
jgi:WD40 repeat protein